MGLFGFLKGKKKKNDGSAYEPLNGVSPIVTDDKPAKGTFIGRDDIIQKIGGGGASSGGGTYVDDTRTSKYDTVDTVYIPFEEDSTDTWVCRECGTVNKKSYDGCVVCGLKNK